MAGLATRDSIVIPDKMLEDAGIDVIIDRATDIDSTQKTVALQSGKTVSYDKLILANGADPVIPPLEGKDLAGVFTLRSTPDAEAMIAYIKDHAVKNLAVVGAGFIGLEVGTLLKTTHPDLNVTIVEMLQRPVAAMLDDDMAARLTPYLEEQGMRMQLGIGVTKIVGENGTVTGIALDTDEIVKADMVLLSVGARTNLNLAEQAGLELGTYGIKINEFMETSDPDILAAGDNVENTCLVTSRKMSGQLRGTAVCQGRLAAKRLAGAAIPFPGVLYGSCVKLFDLCAASVGLSEEAAANLDIKTTSFTVDSRSKHGMIEGMKPWTLKVIFDSGTRKVIGSQIVSMSEAPTKEIDTMNMAIRMGATPEDLISINCAGHPDLSSEPSLEPISIVGIQASGKI